jgi:hypothetical protein
MTQFVIANNVNTQLATATPSSGAGSTTVTLASSANLPTLSAGQIMPLTLNDAATGLVYEIVYVTAISGVTLTVTRAQEGTGAQNWNIGDYAFCAPTAGTVAVATGNPSDTFAVAAATAANQAPQAAQIQTNGLTYAADTGAANAYTVALTPAPTLARGAIVQFTAAHANTGASTLAVNGGTAYPIWGSAHSPVQGGEIVANGYVEVEYNPTLNSGNPVYILLENTGGATQVSPATASQHAVQFGQVAGVVGSVRNLVMSVTAASASATLTADEIIVESALGGLRYCLASFNKTINLATTGAGGMDTGSAPVSGYVGIYAIWNPTTGTAALLATNAATKQGNVYGGANMPSGYTASALVGVWPTNASSQFPAGYQLDRTVCTSGGTALNSSTTQASLTSLSISLLVPANARSVSGNTSVSSTAAFTGSLSVSALGVSPAGAQGVTATVGSAGAVSTGFRNLPVSTAQTIFYQCSNTAGTPTFNISISSYDF